MPAPIARLDQLLSADLDFHDQPSNYASHNFHSFPAKFPPQLPRMFIEGLTAAGDMEMLEMLVEGNRLRDISDLSFDLAV